MFTKQVSRPVDGLDPPIVAAEAEQVERTRRKTWSRARSEVFVPHRLVGRTICRDRVLRLGRGGGCRLGRSRGAPPGPGCVPCSRGRPGRNGVRERGRMGVACRSGARLRPARTARRLGASDARGTDPVGGRHPRSPIPTVVARHPPGHRTNPSQPGVTANGPEACVERRGPIRQPGTQVIVPPGEESWRPPRSLPAASPRLPGGGRRSARCTRRMAGPCHLQGCRSVGPLARRE